MTKLGHHSITLGRKSINRHENLFYMINNSISFSSRYYLHLVTPLILIFITSTIETKMIFMATQQDFLPNQILKRDSAQKIDDFLETIEKILKKRRRLIHASKRKQSILKTVIMNILHKAGKDGLSIATLKIEVSMFAIEQIDVIMIGMNAYCTIYRLKKAHIFAVFMRNLEYQSEKQLRPEIDPGTVILAKYPDFLKVFFKKNSDTHPPH